ncbi:hypothetical protein CPB84DRAFT_1748647 [Gymnopilus junonius]|uniref:Uncharacterized protein n=1 Tax=Gymnopilus junonius TaxID=109634 RepID=A0A9P5TKJ6_GYMJU|nr:hypothetical protein CPB84DRAFT_1748647 [Gymnopilus junonius]
MSPHSNSLCITFLRYVWRGNTDTLSTDDAFAMVAAMVDLFIPMLLLSTSNSDPTRFPFLAIFFIVIWSSRASINFSTRQIYKALKDEDAAMKCLLLAILHLTIGLVYGILGATTCTTEVQCTEHEHLCLCLLPTKLAISHILADAVMVFVNWKLVVIVNPRFAPLCQELLILTFSSMICILIIDVVSWLFYVQITFKDPFTVFCLLNLVPSSAAIFICEVGRNELQFKPFL